MKIKPHRIKDTVVLSDCLIGLKKLKTQSVDLIYLDPPFYTQSRQILTTRDGQKTYQFEDSWRNILDYITYLEVRLIECHRVLKSTGSLFLHCDSKASHYLKVLLDDIFNISNFQSEIIWSYKRWSNSKKGLLNQHQNILFYSKTKSFKFNTIYEGYSATTNVDQIVQNRARDDRNKSTYKKNKFGQIELAEDKPGVPLGDVWDIPFLNPKAKERVQYPTQKPILLIEKIIKLVTDKGDIVVDPFCGSGTTLVAAQLLGRKCKGFDTNINAINLALGRLASPVKTESQLLAKGVQFYAKQNSEAIEIIKNLGATIVQRNKGIDCFLSIQQQLVPIKISYLKKDLNLAIQQLTLASNKNNYQNKAIFCNFKLSATEIKKLEAKNKIFIFNDKKKLFKKLQTNL